MALLTQKQLILAKLESTYNTDPTPTGAANAILVQNPKWQHESARMNDRPAVRPSIATLQKVWGDTLMQISFDVEIKGPGAAYSASVLPEIDPLLQSCGLALTVDTTTGSETATYAPTSTTSAHKSCTIYHYMDGLLQKLTGCRGNASFKLEAGGYGVVSFTFTGHVSTPTDTAMATPTFDSTKPPVVKGASFSIDSYSAAITMLGFDLGNKITTPGSVSASDGFGSVEIVGREINGNFDPEAVLVAAEDYVDNWRTGTVMALLSGTVGSTQYNKYAVSMPGVYYTEITQTDGNGIARYDAKFHATETTTDNELSLAFS